VAAVAWLKGPRPEFDFFSFEEAERFLDAADPEWRPMFTLALRTGLRIGELRALRWDDVDLVAGRLVVRRCDWRGHLGTPKSGRNRELPLSGDALAALKTQRHLKGELVFCAEGGRAWKENEYKWPMWRACKKAGLRKISWHVLRHTFASHLVMKGVPLKAVQELMGHATIEMTLRYSHLSPEIGAERCSCSIGMAIPWQRAPPRPPTSGHTRRKLVEAAGIEGASGCVPTWPSMSLRGPYLLITRVANATPRDPA